MMKAYKPEFEKCSLILINWFLPCAMAAFQERNSDSSGSRIQTYQSKLTNTNDLKQQNKMFLILTEK